MYWLGLCASIFDAFEYEKKSTKMATRHFGHMAKKVRWFDPNWEESGRQDARKLCGFISSYNFHATLKKLVKSIITLLSIK